MKIGGIKFTIKVHTQSQIKGIGDSQTSINLTRTLSPPKSTSVEEEQQKNGREKKIHEYSMYQQKQANNT